MDKVLLSEVISLASCLFYGCWVSDGSNNYSYKNLHVERWIESYVTVYLEKADGTVGEFQMTKSSAHKWLTSRGFELTKLPPSNNPYEEFYEFFTRKVN